MEGSTQYNSGPETTSDCKVSPYTINAKENNIAVAKKAENGASIESPKNVENKLDAKQMSTMIQIFKHDMAQQ